MIDVAVPDGAADGFVRLAAAAPLHVHPDRIVELLRGEDCPWPGGEVARPAVSDLRRYAIDLRLRLGATGGGVTTFSKAAFLDVGQPRRTPHGWEVELSWRAAGAAPLFPVFSGWLIIDGDQLRIDGLYAPPGGTIGRVADRMLLHVAANGTARWLLQELNRAGASG